MLLTFSEIATLFGIAYGVFILIAVFHGVASLKTLVVKRREARAVTRAAAATRVPRAVPAMNHRFEHVAATAVEAA